MTFFSIIYVFCKIEEIRNSSGVDRKRLGIQYGIDPDNLETPLLRLNKFDITRFDFIAFIETLTHGLLGLLHCMDIS